MKSTVVMVIQGLMETQEVSSLILGVKEYFHEATPKLRPGDNEPFSR